MTLVRDQVNQMKSEGKSLEEIIASKPTSKHDEIYYDYTFIKPEDFLTFVYESLAN
jgi:cyclase